MSPWGVKLSDDDEKSMLTVRPRAESGGQSLRRVGLQLVYVCADEGATRRAAEAKATTALMVERMLYVYVRYEDESLGFRWETRNLCDMAGLG